MRRRIIDALKQGALSDGFARAIDIYHDPLGPVAIKETSRGVRRS